MARHRFGLRRLDAAFPGRNGYRFEWVQHVDPIRFEAFHRFAEGCIGRPGKPMSRTPRIVFRMENHAVMCRIPMNVFQAGVIRFRKSDMGVEILEPHFAPGRSIPDVEFPGGKRVQFGEHRFQRSRVPRRGRHEVIVIGQHRPSMKFPSVFPGACEEHVQEIVQPSRIGQPMGFPVGARRDHVGAGLGQAVGRSMGPIAHEHVVL